MSSEYIKHNGQKVKKSSVMSRGKRYRYNKQGAIEEITSSTALTADDFVISGSKSSLRRIGDLEQNVAMLYTRLNTTDGETASSSESSDDISVGKSGTTTRFKGNVRFEKNVDAKSAASVGTTFANKVADAAKERIQDNIIGPMLSGNTESYISVTYDDSANEIDFVVNTGSGGIATRAYADSAATTAVNNIVDGAPAALNTLNELAAAIGDNASYASSITTALSGKASTGTNMVAGNGLTGGGTLAANRTFHVGGGNGITVSANGVAMSGSYTGSFTATGDITAYSDDSLKTNVQVIDGALGRVEQIRGVTFERIEDGSVSTGVIAQELEAVLPEAVKKDEDGVRHVAYGNITGLLIEAVKELSAQVEELKKNK